MSSGSSGRKVFISSSIAYDEDLDDVSGDDPLAGLIWPWMLTAFDDWGRSEASPKRLKNRVFPGNLMVTAEIIEQSLELYEKHGLIILYEVDGKSYMSIDQEKWFKYQTHIRKEKREKDGSKLPPPPNDGEERAPARDSAQSATNLTDCIPSPSPSPSLSLSPSPSKEKNTAAANRAREEIESSQGEVATSQEPKIESFYAAHERVWGYPCNPLQAEKLGAYIDQDGMEESVVIRAIERAAEKGTGYRFGLITKMLNDYLTAGAKTLLAAKALDDDFERKKAAQQSTRSSRGRPHNQSGKPHIPIITQPDSSSLPPGEEEFRQMIIKARRMEGKPPPTEQEWSEILVNQR